jgi:hypothetical protein
MTPTRTRTVRYLGAAPDPLLVMLLSVLGIQLTACAQSEQSDPVRTDSKSETNPGVTQAA